MLSLLLKEFSNGKLGESDVHTLCKSEDRSPTLPTFRVKEEKGKTVEDKK